MSLYEQGKRHVKGHKIPSINEIVLLLFVYLIKDIISCIGIFFKTISWMFFKFYVGLLDKLLIHIIEIYHLIIVVFL